MTTETICGIKVLRFGWIGRFAFVPVFQWDEAEWASPKACLNSDFV